MWLWRPWVRIPLLTLYETPWKVIPGRLYVAKLKGAPAAGLALQVGGRSKAAALGDDLCGKTAVTPFGRCLTAEQIDVLESGESGKEVLAAASLFHEPAVYLGVAVPWKLLFLVAIHEFFRGRVLRAVYILTAADFFVNPMGNKRMRFPPICESRSGHFAFCKPRQCIPAETALFRKD